MFLISGQEVEGLKDLIQLTPCKKVPCRLKKGTNQFITITFTPEVDMDEVKDHVIAQVFGMPLPFVGVDGASVCDKLETESGEKTSCPLKAGTKYVYKDSFPVLNFYPSIDVIVHWSLVHKEKDIICFEIPVKIS